MHINLLCQLVTPRATYCVDAGNRIVNKTHPFLLSQILPSLMYHLFIKPNHCEVYPIWSLMLFQFPISKTWYSGQVVESYSRCSVRSVFLRPLIYSIFLTSSNGLAVLLSGKVRGSQVHTHPTPMSLLSPFVCSICDIYRGPSVPIILNWAIAFLRAL